MLTLRGFSHSLARAAALPSIAVAIGLTAGSAALAQTTPSLPEDAPARIEVAFVLDTTGSMGGLIAGAKQKIWSIANSLIDLDPKPEIKFALIGYRDRGDVYVTKVSDLTEDAQGLYGELMAFRAQGGGDTPESVNQALFEAVTDLSWSKADPTGEQKVFKVLFLVGDAPPHMDYPNDTPYQQTLKIAKQRDIVVNTIQAGDMRETTPIWRDIAQLGGGEFAQIAQDGGMALIQTPYDDEIQRLQLELNETVVPYGEAELRSETAEKVTRSLSLAPSTSSDMASYLAKRGRGVVTGGGDLVDEIASGRLSVDALDEEALPEELQEMAPAARAAFIEQQVETRAALTKKLQEKVSRRDAYLSAPTASSPAPADSFDKEVERMISTQAARKGFERRGE